LGELEQLVLLAVLQAAQSGEAYGITVYDVLIARAHRSIARGAVYITLDRLEKKGLLTSYLTEPKAERGGRSKRCYRVTKAALGALRASRRTLVNLWDGLKLAED
jgi:DNA-binding PadR family transcriptional regulator